MGDFHEAGRIGRLFHGRIGCTRLMALAVGIGFPVQGRGPAQIFSCGAFYRHHPAGVGVDHEGDGLAYQRIGDLEELTQIGYGPILAHPTGLAVIK